MAFQRRLYFGIKKLSRRIIAATILIIVCIDTSCYGLATLPASQNPIARKCILATLQRTQIRYADSEDAIRLLRVNGAEGLLLSSGKYLVSKEVAGNDLRLLRMIVYMDIRAVLQILARRDSSRYRSIKELVLKYFPPPASNTTSVDMYVDHAIARAFQWLVLIDDRIVRREDVPMQELDFIDSILPIIRDNKHNLFTDEFWDLRARSEKIRQALSGGFIFYQAANALAVTTDASGQCRLDRDAPDALRLDFAREIRGLCAKKRIGITGGGSVIGSALIRRILVENPDAQVVVLMRKRAGRRPGWDDLVKKYSRNITIVEGDLMDLPALRRFVKRSDAIFHIAFDSGDRLTLREHDASDRTVDILAANTVSSAVIAKLASEGNKPLIFSSSYGIFFHSAMLKQKSRLREEDAFLGADIERDIRSYVDVLRRTVPSLSGGDPVAADSALGEIMDNLRKAEAFKDLSDHYLYAVHKLIAEYYIKDYPRVMALRIGNIYGPGDNEGRPIPVLIHKAKLSGRQVIANDRRSYIYLDDAVEGFLRAAVVLYSRPIAVSDRVITVASPDVMDSVTVAEKIRGALSTATEFRVEGRQRNEDLELDLGRMNTILQMPASALVPLEEGIRRTLAPPPESSDERASRSAVPSFMRKTVPFIEIHLTNECNLVCKWCSYRGLDRKSHLKFEDLDKIAELAPEEVLFVGGGEPTLYRDGDKTFSDAVCRLKELSPKTRIRLITNGTVVPAGGWQSKVDEISISLDEASKQPYRENKGKDLFDRAWSNIFDKYLVEGPIQNVRVTIVGGTDKIDDYFLLAEKLWMAWTSLVEQGKISKEKARNFSYLVLSMANDTVPDKPYDGAVLTDAQRRAWNERLEAIKSKTPAYYTFLRNHTNMCVRHYDNLPTPPVEKCWSVSNYVLIGADRTIYPCFAACDSCRYINLGSLDQDSAEILARRGELFNHPPERCRIGCRPNTLVYGLKAFELLFEQIVKELKLAEAALGSEQADDYAKAVEYYLERVEIAISMFSHKFALSPSDADRTSYLAEIGRLRTELVRHKTPGQLKGYVASISPELLSRVEEHFRNHRYGSFGGGFTFEPLPPGSQGDPIASVDDIDRRFGSTNVYWPVLSVDAKNDVFKRLEAIRRLGAPEYIESFVKKYVKNKYNVDCDVIATYVNGSYLYSRAKTVPPGDIDNVTFIRVNKPHPAIREMAFDLPEELRNPLLDISGMAIQTIDDLNEDHPHTQTALTSIYAGGIPILERQRLCGEFDRKNMLFSALLLLEDSRLTMTLPDIRSRIKCFNRLAETKAMLYKLGLVGAFDYDAEWHKQDRFMSAAVSGDDATVDALTGEVLRSYVELRTIIEIELEKEKAGLLRQIAVECAGADTDAGRQAVAQGYIERLERADGSKYGFPKDEHFFRAWTSRVKLAIDRQALEREHIALANLGDPTIDHLLTASSPHESVLRMMEDKGLKVSSSPVHRRGQAKSLIGGLTEQADPERVRQSMEELVLLGEDALPELIDLTESGNILARQRALYGLGKIGSPRAVPFIVKCCTSVLASKIEPESAEESILNIGIGALAKCGSDKAVAFLFGLIEAGAMSDNATMALRQEAVRALLELCGNPGLKIDIAWRLGQSAGRIDRSLVLMLHLSQETMPKNSAIEQHQHPEITADAGFLTILAFDLIHAQLRRGRIYEIKYDASRLTDSQIGIIEAYAASLRTKCPEPQNIKVRPFSSARGSNDSLIAVYCSGDGFTGEGHVDVSIPEGNIEEYILRITGMINIALASSNIPDKLSDEDVETYRPILSYIRNQYRALLGIELAVPGNAVDILKVIRKIVLDLPKSLRMNIEQIEEYNRLACAVLVDA